MSNMSKGSAATWILIIVIVAIIAAGAWWFFSQSNSTTSQPSSATTTQSSEKLINSFTFSGLTPSVGGSVDNTNYTVNLTVPTGTDLTSLTPTISVPDNVTISPNSGLEQNFTKPVTYIVTAQDSSTQSYTVTVTTSANPTDSITSFNFGIAGEVDNIGTGTVSINVPSGTDVTNLTPIIAVSAGSTISPTSDTVEDFTNPVAYTVAASDGLTTQTYSVTVNVASGQ
jgi:hypothetical protein